MEFILTAKKYVLTVACPSTRGIVAAISGYLAEKGCNIVDSSQFEDVETGKFFMSRAVLEAEAVVSGLKDVAMMREPVEQRGCHLCIAEDAGPFAEAEIGRDDDAGALVEFAQQMEEQRTT